MSATHQSGYDFEGVHPEELSVRAGEPLVVVNPAVDGWTKCRSLATGKEGFVPESYIKPFTPQAAVPRRAPPRAPGGSAPVPPAAMPSFPPPQAQPPQVSTLASKHSSGGKASSGGYADLTRRGGGEYEIDKSSIAYDQNLGEWRERERRFKKGEAERLPQVKEREYYFWDVRGVRQGPFTEAEMKGRFDSRQVGADTLIAPITTSTGSEALPKQSVNDYFPDAAQAFATAPVPPLNHHSWLYLDDAGEVQGPFDSSQMREWFLDNYFNAETKAKLASRTDIGFVPLGVLFGPDGAEAFLSDGDQLTASQYPQTFPKPPPALRAPLAPTPFAAAPYSDPFMTSSSGSNLMGYSDPYGLPPLGPSSAVPPAMAPTNPFASPARSPSGRSLGLTPKAQSGRLLLSMAINGTPPPPGSSNPFEAPDYRSPAKSLDQAEDDWGITWDDEKPEAEAAGGKSGSTNDEAAPLPVTGAGAKDTRVLAPFNKIQRDYLSSHEALYHFLTRALPKDLGTVKCKIRRSTVGMMHVNYNYYELFLEKDDGTLGPQIMVGEKHKRMGFDSYFQMQIGSATATHAGTVIGELVMSTLGTQFLLHNNVKTHSGRARDLGCVHYLRTGSGGGPRKMTVAIPGFLKNSETEFVEWAHGGSIKKSNLVSAIESLNFKDIQPLMNKPPVWSEKRSAWTLNFHGRVTRASVKNFQLVRPEDHNHIVLQHGRVGQDTFTMDMAWPLSPMQAFAVCLTSLHAKLGVE